MAPDLRVDVQRQRPVPYVGAEAEVGNLLSQLQAGARQRISSPARLLTCSSDAISLSLPRSCSPTGAEQLWRAGHSP